MECAGQVEIDPYCQAVLAKHWPNVKRMGDIREVKGNEFGAVDLICGGFPCQPFSTAGQRRGSADDRYLWPEMLRVISSVRPVWVICENVVNFGNMALSETKADLESRGYQARPFNIPACAVDADHPRRRIYLVAHSDEIRRDMRKFKRQRVQWEKSTRNETHSSSGRGWTFESKLDRTLHGVPSKLDKCRVAALGNAVVPQVIEEIGKAIMQIEERENLKHATTAMLAPGASPVAQTGVPASA